jgi:mevalonate pyrophosphate decarboxylase
VEDSGWSYTIRRSVLYETRQKKERDHSFDISKKMKSKDLQKVVFSKYENGESLAKNCRDLNGVISYRTIKR